MLSENIPVFNVWFMNRMRGFFNSCFIYVICFRDMPS